MKQVCKTSKLAKSTVLVTGGAGFIGSNFIINQLLQIDLNSPLYITNTGIIVSMPNDEDHTYGWHKEYFTTIPDSKYFQIWSPMVDNATTDLGTIMVCPGSHLNEWKGQVRVQNNRESKRTPSK